MPSTPESNRDKLPNKGYQTNEQRAPDLCGPTFAANNQVHSHSWILTASSQTSPKKWHTHSGTYTHQLRETLCFFKSGLHCTASKKAITGFFGFCCCWTPSKKEVFYYIMLNGVVTSSRALTCPVLANKVIWLLGHCWVDTHTPLRETLCFFKSWLSSDTVAHSDSVLVGFYSDLSICLILECLLIVSQQEEQVLKTKEPQISGTSSPGAWGKKRGTNT